MPADLIECGECGGTALYQCLRTGWRGWICACGASKEYEPTGQTDLLADEAMRLAKTGPAGSTHACAVCGRADQPLWQLFSQGPVSQPVCIEAYSCLAHLYEKKKTS